MELFEFGGVAGGAHKVVFGDEGSGLVGGGAAVNHGSRFGVVFGRVQVQIQQVLCGVFADSEVAGADAVRDVIALAWDLSVFGVLVFVFATTHLLVLALTLLLLLPLAQLLHAQVVVNDTLVLARVIAVPAIAFAVPAKLDRLDNFVGLDVGAGPLCAELAGARETFLGLVRGGAAVLTRAFAELCRARELQPALVPFLGGEIVGFGFLETLMLD